MYVLSWWTVYALTRALFQDQNNPPVSAKTVQQTSPYIIQYLQHDMKIDRKQITQVPEKEDNLNKSQQINHNGSQIGYGEIRINFSKSVSSLS